jgi:uncharacterized protein YyaL (SSP411 family)
MRYFLLVTMLLLAMIESSALAFEHEESLVEFVEYSEDVVRRNRNQNKPYFVLFAAEWCHWCRVFAENTLTRQDVADYLNQNFVNVFVDADIHNAAYVKYRATGLPFTVFLNPDGTLYYKYTGTLYGDNFLAVISEVATEVGAGKFALGMEAYQVSYTAPRRLDLAALQELPDAFKQGLLENFDAEEYGLGRERKLILPRTYSYLLQQADVENRNQAIKQIEKTLRRAIDKIYDPLEGGFFRYAEKRNWQIPHYEKFADLNAGTVLLLYQINQVSPSPELKQAADLTLDYLTSTLFDVETGSFLSFQIADTYYYSLNQKQRESARKPKIMSKIFTDRLAMTLSYLIQIDEIIDDQALQDQIRQSLDFLLLMINQEGGLKRYYSIADNQWLTQSGLSDHALIARLLVESARHFDDPRYADLAASVLHSAVTKFYNKEKGIFIEPSVKEGTNIEYLMEMNAMLALSIMGLGDRLDPGGTRIVKSVTTYFSGMVETLDQRFWNAVEWEFAESYVPFLQVVDKFLASE